MNPLPLRVANAESLTTDAENNRFALSVTDLDRAIPRPIIVPASLFEDEYSAVEPVQAEVVQHDYVSQSSASSESIKRGVKLMRLARTAARGFGK